MENTTYYKTQSLPSLSLRETPHQFAQLRPAEIPPEGVRASGQSKPSSGSILNPPPSPSLRDVAPHLCLVVFLGSCFLSSQAMAVLLLGT